MSAWGNPSIGKQEVPLSISSILAEEEAKQSIPSSSFAREQPSTAEDEEDQLRLALAISASLAVDENGGKASSSKTEEQDEHLESLSLARKLAAETPISPSCEDESLALAHALAVQDKFEFEQFQRLNRSGNKNTKVQVEYFRGSAAERGSAEDSPPERFGADDAERYNILYGDGHEVEDEEEVYKMNDNNTANKFMRVGNTVINSKTGEVLTKHDPKLKMVSNANNLQLGKEAKIGNAAFNKLRRDISKGQRKGVAAHGHGRAEDIAGGKTHSGALDSSTLQVIRKAIDKGYINVCHGVVREGKEGIVLYAEGGGGGKNVGDGEEDGGPFSPSYTPDHLCVKVYKRIVAFKNRGEYIDGDQRYYKKRFSDVDKRDQLTLWAEKEFRNMTRAFVGGVSCPRPVMTKENVCMMTFLGNDGFPAPTLKEVADLGFVGIGEKKLKRFFAEAVVAIRRLWWCAQLVHGDLSEYNLLLCESKQIRDQVKSKVDDDIEGETSMDVGKRRIVVIDFAQSVQRDHPAGMDLLERDVARVCDFFDKFFTTPEASSLLDLILDKEGVREDEGGEGEGGWVDLSEEDEEANEEANVEAGFVDLGGSTTTSVRKRGWRHRKVMLNDKKTHAEVLALCVSKL